MGETCGIRRAKRRLLVSTTVALLASAFVVEPAFAQLLPGSAQNGAQPSLGSTVGTLTQALPTGQVAQQAAPVVQKVAEQAAPLVQQAAQPVAQTTAPVAQATVPITQRAAPVVRQAAAPVVTAVAPVVRATAPVLAAAQPVIQSAAPVLEAAQPVVEATKPVLEATGQALEATTPLRESAAALVGTSKPLVPSADTEVTGTALEPASSTAQTGPALATSFVSTADRSAQGPVSLTPEPRPGPGGGGREPVGGHIAPDGLIGVRTAVTPSGHSAPSARAVVPRRPAPSTPEGPVGLLAAISAAFASSAGLLFVAALAAAMLLAVPGLGRRLRASVAPWPLPISLASLERPG